MADERKSINQLERKLKEEAKKEKVHISVFQKEILVQRITKMLIEWGFLFKNLGTIYIRDGILYMVENPREEFLAKQIYAEIARINKVPSRNVSPRIRKSIEVAWQEGKPRLIQFWNSQFGENSKKPTSYMFIKAIASRIKENLYWILNPEKLGKIQSELDWTDEEVQKFIDNFYKDFVTDPYSKVRPQFINIDRRINSILYSLGFSFDYKGTRYISEALKYIIQSEMKHIGITTQVYPYLGEKFQISILQAERNIGYAIQKASDKGQQEFRKLFPESIGKGKSKPTNGQFLCLLAEQIRQDLL